MPASRRKRLVAHRPAEGGFGGLRVAAFESRMAAEMSRLIQSHGGVPVVAPSMREIPLEENHEALAFGERLLAGEFDMVILMTGVGTRTLVGTLETRHARADIIEALRRVARVCRGPKPVAALRSFGLDPGLQVPEPNTWVEILATLDEQSPVRGRKVAVQEYGVSNLELIQGLKERGAEVTRVPVYRWSLPEDLEPLRRALRAIASGDVGVALFTNANQVENVMQVARDSGLDAQVRAALSRGVVASVGPVASESLRNHGLTADLEPAHPKMGTLVVEASRRCREILAQKRGDDPDGGPGGDPGGGRDGDRAAGRVRAEGAAASGAASGRTAADTVTGAAAGAAAGTVAGAAPGLTEALAQSIFMKACRKEPVPVTPVWLMRQAGRYQREYRQIRARRSFLDMCRDPDLVTQITVYAVERLGVDAAIIFADLLLPVPGFGLNLAYNKGEGPVIDPPLRTGDDVRRLRRPEIDETVGYVFEAIRRTRRALPPGIPLLGFAGAPFTMASYMIEGGGSTHYVQTRSFMLREPEAWHDLLDRIATATIAYVNGQIAAGAQAVQIFDTWVGCLSAEDYRAHVLPHTRKVIASLTPGAPIIHFGTQTAHLLSSIRRTGAGIIGLDWRVDLADTWKELGDVAVMGNLDPTVLFGPRQEVAARAQAILRRAGGRPGHIFNLGHGILPHTPLDNVIALVDAVHAWRRD